MRSVIDVRTGHSVLETASRERWLLQRVVSRSARLHLFGSWFAAALLVGKPSSAVAQLQVSQSQELAFGQLVARIPKTVVRTDGSRSGKFVIQGPEGALVSLQLILPAVMRGPGTALLPMSFSSTDAGYAPNNGLGNQTAFDPRGSFSVTLGSNGRGVVSLGGTATAAPTGQASGSYTATLTLIVALLQ
ncbi:MAG: DUF4402 domain-containing protein [Gemmatimonadales bacterium]|nr:DUF4402 domain-containing protein [Gemmatimonadales bacterium]